MKAEIHFALKYSVVGGGCLIFFSPFNMVNAGVSIIQLLPKCPKISKLILEVKLSGRPYILQYVNSLGNDDSCPKISLLNPTSPHHPFSLNTCLSAASHVKR